jgi:SAM-dependent methyltransferase
MTAPPWDYSPGVPGLWDETLYEGSAEYYLAGRMPYPQRLADNVQRELDLTGQERLLDLGCGPGSLTVLLAPLVTAVVAVDADAEMLRVAEAEASRRGIVNVTWLRCHAEDLPLGGLPFHVVTMAQSFHWMDQPAVAVRLRRLLVPGGHCVHVSATTHEGEPEATGTEHPTPPRDRITALVRDYLGPQRRAGQGTVDKMERTEDAALAGAGFTGPQEVEIDGGDTLTRTEDQVVASVFSLSSAAPHLFGERLAQFEHDLRGVLRSVSPERVFTEVTQPMRLSLWRS